MQAYYLFFNAKERPRPEFEQEIKRRIRKLESKGQAEKAKKYRQFNPVYEVSATIVCVLKIVLFCCLLLER